jgi:predicted RNase H-like HicB family nuclease
LEENLQTTALRYSIFIQWSDEDQAYLVTVPELPGCITHGATYEEAVRQGQEAIETWIEGALAIHLPVPPPQTAAMSA